MAVECDKFNAFCINHIGSFECKCLSGMRNVKLENGVNIHGCIDIDECKENTSSCSSNTECRNTIGSYVCNCRSGYKWSMGQCLDVNECESDQNGCDDHSVCVNTNGSYFCECQSGWNMTSDLYCLGNLGMIVIKL